MATGFGYEALMKLPGTLETIFFRFAESQIACCRLVDQIQSNHINSSTDIIDGVEIFNYGSRFPLLKNLTLDSFKWDKIRLGKVNVVWSTARKISFIKMLPKSLESLHLQNCDGISQHILLELPNLKSYVLKDPESRPIISQLPTSILNLTLDLSHQVLMVDDISHLPTRLTHLDIVCQGWTDRHIEVLPKTLVKFMCFEIGSKLSDAALSAFPRGLTTLDLRHSTSPFTNEGIKNLSPNLEEFGIGESNQLEEDFVYLLPTTIHTLRWNTANKSISSCFFKGLPPNLTHLSLPRLPVIEDSLLSLLRPNLKTLDLGGNKSLTDSSMQYIPSTLEHLMLEENENFTYEVISKIPRNLKTFAISRLDFTGAIDDSLFEKDTRKMSREEREQQEAERLDVILDEIEQFLQDLPEHLEKVNWMLTRQDETVAWLSSEKGLTGPSGE